MYRQRSTFEYLQVTPEGRYLRGDLSEVLPPDVVQVCDVCEEPGTDRFGGDDVLAEFWVPDEKRSIVAHAQCGTDQELELA